MAVPNIEQTIIRYPNVELAEPFTLEAFVILGSPAGGASLPTYIGPRALVRSHTVIYAGNHIGADFQTGHGVLIRESNEIGEMVSVGSHSVIEHHVKIADKVRIHSQVFVPEFSTLEEGCWLGPCVALTNARYPRSAGVKENLQGPVIGRGAKLGAGAVILPGVHIGAEAIIGAGAVVTHDVPNGAVVVGNPASILKYVSDIPAYNQLKDE